MFAQPLEKNERFRPEQVKNVFRSTGLDERFGCSTAISLLPLCEIAATEWQGPRASGSAGSYDPLLNAPALFWDQLTRHPRYGLLLVSTYSGITAATCHSDAVERTWLSSYRRRALIGSIMEARYAGINAPAKDDKMIMAAQ